MEIRPATAQDDDAIWALFQEVVRAGDVFAFDATTTRAEALKLWKPAHMALLGGEVVGSYYIKPNQPGRGAHVCNAGYMVAERARGRGVGRAMGEHSIAEARRLGYRAMQYNFVVATNTGALALWQKLGFAVVGRLPQAFRHSEHGLVDALVLHRLL
ncbi:MAG TPA: GNAT family N-acetyltransferase [Candidatus Polarisedimenticolaceae bacterium]|nr:GNAT family N-acetyltransferase [Candidatus Polarisedimenticolaceae bacterium]